MFAWFALCPDFLQNPKIGQLASQRRSTLWDQIGQTPLFTPETRKRTPPPSPPERDPLLKPTMAWSGRPPGRPPGGAGFRQRGYLESKPWSGFQPPGRVMNPGRLSPSGVPAFSAAAWLSVSMAAASWSADIESPTHCESGSGTSEFMTARANGPSSSAVSAGCSPSAPPPDARAERKGSSGPSNRKPGATSPRRNRDLARRTAAKGEDEVCAPRIIPESPVSPELPDFHERSRSNTTGSGCRGSSPRTLAGSSAIRRTALRLGRWEHALSNAL